MMLYLATNLITFPRTRPVVHRGTQYSGASANFSPLANRMARGEAYEFNPFSGPLRNMNEDSQ